MNLNLNDSGQLVTGKGSIYRCFLMGGRATADLSDGRPYLAGMEVTCGACGITSISPAVLPLKESWDPKTRTFCREKVTFAFRCRADGCPSTRKGTYSMTKEDATSGAFNVPPIGSAAQDQG